MEAGYIRSTRIKDRIFRRETKRCTKLVREKKLWRVNQMRWKRVTTKKVHQRMRKMQPLRK